MENLSIAERFAILGLNGKESEHWNLAKHYVLKGIAASFYLEENYNSSTDTWTIQERDLCKYIKKSRAKEVEKQIIARLNSKQMIGKVKSLLGCDLFYDENIKIKEYVSDIREYEYQLDYFRAEFFEEGPISDEGIILAWLLKGSLCLYDLFSLREQEIIRKKMDELQSKSGLARVLYSIEIQSVIGSIANGFLRMKTQFAATPFGKGINFIFPFLDRKQSVFVDMEEYFTNAEKRLQCVLDRVTSQGHTCEVLHYGDVPIVKIDNIKYELVPEAIVVKLPIHGVRLRRYD
ncbi:MAG: hypothetical protein GX306_05830 [Clostridiales bacterium]|nr:hypothetical protein [Clostridiales bacterium]